MKIAVLATLLALAVAAPARATEQIPDEVEIDGTAHRLFALPFSAFIEQDERAGGTAWKKLESYVHEQRCTASLTGYRAFWKIDGGDQLQLVKLVANPCSNPPKQVPLGVFFPGAKGPVPATWYSGKLIVPAGNAVQRIPLGYGANYDKYLVLTVDKGKVTQRVETAKP